MFIVVKFLIAKVRPGSDEEHGGEGEGREHSRKGLELALWFPYLISQSLQVSGVTVGLIYRSITPVSRQGWRLAGAVWVSYGN